MYGEFGELACVKSEFDTVALAFQKSPYELQKSISENL